MSFAETIEAFDVEDYLSSHTKLRKSGVTNFVGNPCPICGDRKSKFYVNGSGDQHNGMWNSYCCHDQGNLVDLVMKIENVGRLEAISQIKAAVEGEPFQLIPVIQQQMASPGRLDEPTCVFPEPLSVASAQTLCMISGRPGTLSERGVDDYIVSRHQLRVTGGYTHYKGARRRDLDNRLVIPVKMAGNSAWAGWQARDLTGGARAKYVFPTGDRSAETLYDFDAFVEGGGNTLLIVEGVFGKWAWDRLGRQNGRRDIETMAVASFGKKLTKEQEDLIVNCRQITTIVLGWDLDAAAEVIKTAQRLNGRKKVLVMPAHDSGRDHDELQQQELVKLFLAAEAFDLAKMTAVRTALALRGIS